MKYRLDVRPAADRQFSRLTWKVQKAVLAALDELEAEPRHPGIAAVRGKPGALRARAGDYRILFRIDDQRRVVSVGRIALRDRVYKRLRDVRFD